MKSLGRMLSCCLVVPAVFLQSNLCVGFEETTNESIFELEIEPLLSRYCVRCHNAEKAGADIRIDSIDPDVVAGEHFDRWEDIREAFNSGEMPPEDEPQPNSVERERITAWLDSEFKKVKQSGMLNSRGSLRRLTRYELQYALEDLLHLNVQEEVSSLPEEATSIASGLKNNSRLLMISGPHLESYLDVILAVTQRLKKVVSYVPYTESLDIANVDTQPKQAFTRDGRKIKPPVGNVERDGKNLVLKPKGYLDLPIPEISKFKFQTLLSAKSAAAARIGIAIGFTRSDIDPRQNLAALGNLQIEPGESWKTYTLDSLPSMLPRQMTRALDRPFFIRVTNPSSNDVDLKAFEYRGNVNAELRDTLIPQDLKGAALEDHVREKIASFLLRAFRRQPTQRSIQRYVEAFQKYSAEESPIAALVSTYKEILCSPSFFYVGAHPAESNETLTNFKVAEKLAFFLWCSVPDQELLSAAANGELAKGKRADASGIASQTQRMLEDEKSKRWVRQFADQWLQTSQLFNVAVDKNYYARFNEQLKEWMYQETIESVQHVFRQGAPATDLLDADYIFVNQPLASHYGIKGVRGNEFKKVKVGEKVHRGGLLTQGTFLVGNSDGMNSHAILRGVWLSSVILNDPPPDPPKNVPPLDESVPGFDKMTLNEKLFAHRNHDACRNCHRKIDPWGIPFENYDAAGAWREKVLVLSKEVAPESTPPPKKRRGKRPALKKSLVEINQRATLPDKVDVNGIEELKQHLLKHYKHDFAEALTERILAYALSRDIDYHDEDLVKRLTDSFEQSGYSVPKLISDIVQSEKFCR